MLRMFYFCFMARLVGPIRIVGRLGDLSLYESEGKIVVRKKWGPNRKRLNTDESFWKVKAHQEEFAACVKAGALLRRAFRPLLQGAQDKRHTGRLTGVMNALKNLDPCMEPGKRRVAAGLKQPGALELLNGFDFNGEAPLSHLLKLRVQMTGRGMHLEGLSAKAIRYPKGATHVQLRAAAAELHFEERRFVLSEVEAPVLMAKGSRKTTELILEAKQGQGDALVFVLQAIFFKEEKGVLVAMEEGVNGCGIVGLG